jgi:hypothetical protein
VKLYIAQRNYDHEGFTVIGIFSTFEKADTACKNDKWPDDGRMRGDWHDVGEFELDVIAE